MNKTNLRFGIIISLLIALIFTMSFAIGALLPRKNAHAATYAIDKIYFTGGVGASVAAYKEGNTAEDKAYVGFNFTQDNSRVYYYHSLAYKWFVSDKDADTTGENALQNPGKAEYFSIRFSFPSVDFEKVTLIFESTEENVTKDGKSTNEISFELDENGQMTASVTPSVGDVVHLRTQSSNVTDWTKGDFTLSFKEGTVAGDFALSLVYSDGENTVNYFSDSESDKARFAFTNIGDNYAEYRSSSATKPITPLAFRVDFPESKEGEETTAYSQTILLKELNKQSMEVTAFTQPDNPEPLDDGTVAVTGGSINDTQAPALVLSEEVYSFTLGQKYSLTHHAIDVLDDSVVVNRSYHIAKKGDDGNYVKPDESKSDEYKTLSTSVFFMPVDDTDPDEPVYLSIRFELQDGRTSQEGEDKYVYLSWYAHESAVSTQNGWDYVKAETSKENPKYAIVSADDENKENVGVGNNEHAQEVVENIQSLVEAAAKEANAGDGAYIYLPSLRDLFTSSSCDYRNLKFNIYYFTKEQTETSSALSETGLSYNNLRLPVKVEGEYLFRVVVSDSAGNTVKLYNDKHELVDVTSSNIWDIDEIPEFRFYVEYKGATIEDSGEQTLGYRETTYNIDKFEIVALSGYATDYTLYRVDEDLISEKAISLPTYSSLVREIKSYMEDEDHATFRECLDTIEEYNDKYTEDDEEWSKTSNDYNWRPDSSLSFNPQKSGFYILKVTVTDAHLASKSVDGYQVIEIRNPLDVTPGRSTWLRDNTLSVVLFSISGLLMIAIVVLFIVNPSEKTPETVDLEKLKGKKKNKPEKKD